MQIHELNNFNGAPGSSNYLAIDNGTDTGRISGTDLLAPVNGRIDNLVANVRPTSQETLLLEPDGLGGRTATLGTLASDYDFLEFFFADLYAGEIVQSVKAPVSAGAVEVSIPIGVGAGTNSYYQRMKLTWSGSTLTCSNITNWEWDGNATHAATSASGGGFLCDLVRVDGIKISTDQNTEVIDLRTAHDGTVYSTARAAREADYNALDENINRVHYELVNTNVEPIPLSGKDSYINTNVGGGNTVSLTPLPSSSGLCYSIVECSQGDIFTINGTGASSGLLFAFVDSSNKLLWFSGPNATLKNFIIEAPKNSAKLIINCRRDKVSYKGVLAYTIINLQKLADRIAKGVEVNISKAFALENYTRLIYGGFVFADVGVIGADINNLFSGFSDYAQVLKIPCEDFTEISFPTFKSSSGNGSVFIDENNIVVGRYTESVAETGAIHTMAVPTTAKYFCLGLNAGLTNTIGWDITVKPKLREVDEDLQKAIDLLYGKTVTKAEALATYQKSHENAVYYVNNIVVGETTEQNAPTYGLTGAYVLKIPLDNIKSISYPTFKSTSGGGSIICDANDVIIWAYNETQEATGTNKLINIPANASYFMLQTSPSLNALDWSISLYALEQLDEERPQEAFTPFIDQNRNMCLAGIKTDILDNKIPYHRGFLFHKLQNNDGSLWYGPDFEHIYNIGSPGYNPTLMRFAISPKDGRIIAVQRDVRNGIYVWDGSTMTHVSGFPSDPQAWLYNSGVDFIKDGNGDEYCIFAEYSSSVVSGSALNVWRGKYPYTSISDWSIVMTQNQVQDITHFHMVRRDPWTNILYLTAGDSSAESKWWYSTDYGATWTLLVSGTVSGWGNSLCRTINFIFTKDYIYWATDHGEAGTQHHTLNRIQRDSNTGVMDLSSKEQLTLLPQLYATNSLCYVESPNGLFMYDRIDVSSSSVFGEPIKMLFWDFDTEQLVEIASLKLTSNTWGGSRGKCYINYTNSKEVMPAMGFSIDTPCIFDLVCDNPANIGTIAYDIGSKTVHTINY